MLKIIVKRIERKLEAEINVVQAGFRQGRGTHDHLFNLRMIIQKCREFTNHFSHALWTIHKLLIANNTNNYGPLLGKCDFQKESCH